jgi:hypothetical protein
MGSQRGIYEVCIFLRSPQGSMLISSPSVTPLKANFMHAAVASEGELKL